MREIKFRGKSSTSGEWKTGSLCLINEQALIIPSPLPVYGEGYDEDKDDQNVIPDTVGQFTGRVDKNGVDIYEGDIVKHHNDRPITKEEYWFPLYKICFGSLGFCLKRVGGGKSTSNPQFILRNYASEFEVVGNIYDNPELINE